MVQVLQCKVYAQKLGSVHMQRTPVVASSFSTGPAGMSSQRNQSDSFQFKRAAFYQSLKSKVGLAATKAAALRINLNVVL